MKFNQVLVLFEEIWKQRNIDDEDQQNKGFPTISTVRCKKMNNLSSRIFATLTL